jgi:competence protein ComEC
MERPLFLPLLAIICGLVAADTSSLKLSVHVLVPLLAISFVALFLTTRHLFHITLFLLCFAWGCLSLDPHLHPDFPSSHVVHLASNEPRVVEGIIVSRPEATDTGYRLLLDTERLYEGADSKPLTGRLLLYLGEGKPEMLTGDRVRCVTRIKKPRMYGLPGEFDYPGYLAYRDIFATGFVKSGNDVILMEGGADFALQRGVDAIARHLGKFMDAHLPKPENGVLKALLLGDRGSVPRELGNAYTRSGVNHILSISGFHVGIISLFLFNFLLIMCRASEFLLLHLDLRRTLLLVTLPVLVFYLFLSGAAPATARSVLTIAVYVVALALQRETDPVNSLLLAALVILGITPAALFDLSFQLSFLAIWGILVLVPIFNRPFFGKLTGGAEKLLLFFFVSLAATLVTIIPVAYYFHRVSFTGLVSNFVVVPLMGYGAVVLGFSALPLVYLAPPLANVLLLGAAWLVRISDWFILLCAKAPVLPLLNPDRLDLLLFFLVMMAVTFLTHRRMRYWSVVVLTAGLAFHLFCVPDPDAGRLRVSFLSIGQGDATLVRFPDGRTMLVDGGGNRRGVASDVGERLLAPALWKLGITRIDYLVLTHPHPDHMQGVAFVAANFRIGEFWESGKSASSAEYVMLKETLAAKRVPSRVIDANSPAISIGSIRVEPLAPVSSGMNKLSSDDENEDSLVFRLVAGKTSVLFTGDIGAVTEAELLRRHADVQCTILKVAHHGSRFSSSLPFLKAAVPRHAVISVGFGNSFHLPAPVTVSNLERCGTAVYRTDQDGTIEMQCSEQGEDLRVSTMAGHFH